MDFLIKRIVRHTQLALLATISVSAMGCWNEVHYDPGKTEPMARQRGLAVEILSPGDAPVSAQAEETPSESSSQGLAAVEEKALEAPPRVPNPTRTAQAAWQLGSQWSLGAALFAKGLPAERYQPMLEQAASAAQLLQLELELLPKVAADKQPVATVVTYLLDQQGSRLAGKLRQRYDPRHAALMELATRSHMLLLVYSPRNLALDRGALGREQFQAWVDRLADLASSSRLPRTGVEPTARRAAQAGPLHRGETGRVRTAPAGRGGTCLRRLARCTDPAIAPAPRPLLPSFTTGEHNLPRNHDLRLQ